MDREQEEMQFLGLFGIYVEAYNLVFRWRKIFSQITLSLIFPLSFIFLAHLEISHQLSLKISYNEIQLEDTQSGTQQKERLHHLVTSEFAILCLFKLVYFTFFLVFSLLSTAAVVYTIACIYTGHEIAFKKVMSVVPKVWKRLMVTFLCTFLAFLLYNFVAIILLVIFTFALGDTVIGAIFITILLILYVVGFLYMSIIWQLASVVSVLEDSYGIKAMMKSKELIKGKVLISIIIFFKLNLGMAVIQLLFDFYVIHGGSWRLGLLHRIGFGILCFLLLFKLILFGLVIQTIIYFVCKSYHHENIDKSVLSDHLEEYLGDYVPLKAKDVQLEEYDQA
ncbi:OLC1v1016527C1 [Oldenlandia corymbosa var. corymbosa]|uniref:OLC1v1016527C1 n=1 Tax=Oldenlandia corymbosa var. corymbosa TaxID=529605 RepID=A0AAV1E6Z0_OLDCO|nr:OLC1v1016527C1 [Oldenlandia corymbosa var. corymbosa]